MKRIVQHYGADLDWIASFAKNFEGEVDGNFIRVPDRIFTGDVYILNCGEGIVALYVDATYHTNFRLIHKNLTDDFVGIYYNLSDSEVKSTYEETYNHRGPWDYNLYVIDSSLEYQTDIHSGTKCFVLAIFIKKEVIKRHFERNNIMGNTIDELFNPSTNTLIRWDRMSSDSSYLLSELRKKEVGGVVFDLDLIATGHLLVSEYLLKILNNYKVMVQLVDEHDLSGIMGAQQFLIENIQKPYPGTKIVAQTVNMSETKFKKLFKKVTGFSANTFFLDNKLVLAKELLEKKEMTVADVTSYFSFTDSSYFAGKFKKKFGVNPKQFKQHL